MLQQDFDVRKIVKVKNRENLVLVSLPRAWLDGADHVATIKKGDEIILKPIRREMYEYASH